MPDAYEAHRVVAGECLSSIAKEVGLPWETIWNDSKNAELKELRGDPNVLFPGDVVYIRARKKKEEPCAPEQRHRFRVLNQPAMFRLVLLKNDEPRANEPYRLEVAGTTYDGTTDAEGKLEHPLPPDATVGRLFVGPEEENPEEFQLKFGELTPVREIKGAQQRLLNLGIPPGPIDGIMGPLTEAALRAFQRKYGLTENGQLDRDTAERLVNEHGC